LVATRGPVHGREHVETREARRLHHQGLGARDERGRVRALRQRDHDARALDLARFTARRGALVQQGNRVVEAVDRAQEARAQQHRLRHAWVAFVRVGGEEVDLLEVVVGSQERRSTEQVLDEGAHQIEIIRLPSESCAQRVDGRVQVSDRDLRVGRPTRVDRDTALGDTRGATVGATHRERCGQDGAGEPTHTTNSAARHVTAPPGRGRW
jgi:hypothetical protein